MSSNEVVEKKAMEAIDKFDYIRFTFGDIHGIARSKSIARRNFHEFFAEGMTIFSGEHCLVLSLSASANTYCIISLFD